LEVITDDYDKIRYHGKWAECVQTAATHKTAMATQYSTYYGNRQSSGCGSCGLPTDFMAVQVLTQLLKGTVSLSDLDVAFNPSFLCCDYMKSSLHAWRLKVEADIKQIPNFTTFL
jgi:hypothetical protein